MDEHTHHHQTKEDATHAHNDHGPSHHEHKDHHGHHAAMVEDFKRRFFVSILVSIPILLLSPMIQGWLGIGEALAFTGSNWILFGLSAFVYIYGGWPFLKGMVDELREKNPGMMTLVALAISVAFFYSAAVVLGLEGKLFFWETATLIDLMLLGHWIEMRSVMGASRALEELARLMPSEAHRIGADGEIEDVPIAELQEGDVLLIKSSEKIPADGEITEGTSTIDESMLTGESRPVEKAPGDAVIAGSINGGGSIRIKVNKTGEASYLNQVIDLVRTAQQSKSKTQDLANRAAFYLTLVAITVGVVTFAVWFFATSEDLTFAIERAVTVMVITCPHALGLAIPLVVAVSTSISAKRGLLIRNRSAFEQARHLDTIVFDKTGTLTEGRFGVTDVQQFSGESEDALIRLAAAVEQGSEHPIAAGIVREAKDRNLNLPETKDFEAITGKGVQARVEGKQIQILSPGAVEKVGLTLSDDAAGKLGKQGKTVVYVVEVVEGELTVIGSLALADVIRASSKDAIATLHKMGIQAVMLTGDKQEVADYVAAELNLDQVIAEVLPDQKSDHIKRLQKEGRHVAMTGDGVNDAPALATADVGIAIGAGTDVAVETADIVLVDSDPADAVRVIELARATYRKMIQNLWYAAGYNIVAIPLAAGVFSAWGIILSPAVGAVLMSLSTVVVAINARFLKVT